jgi:ankyrin repeat protein
MKTICSTALIGLFLLLCTGEIAAQTGPEAERSENQTRAKDLINTLAIVRSIKNVNYTDTYDRTYLMYASAKGYMQACRILIRRGADPDLQALDGFLLRSCQDSKTVAGKRSEPEHTGN